MEHPILYPRTPIADLLAGSQPTAGAFLQLRVDCIGCSMNRFCTLEDMSRYYDLKMETILGALQGSMEGPE